MKTPRLRFEIATVNSQEMVGSEISELLTQVYVGGGFTTPEAAASLFEPAAVMARGVVIVAFEKIQSKLAGAIILVPPKSPYIRLAKNSEAELHLLALRQECRRHGTGRMLVNSAIDKAIRLGCSKLILWTQISMDSAQRLYESAGFIHIDNIEVNGREFKVYERILCAQ